MDLSFFSAFVTYFSLVVGIGFIAYIKSKQTTDFSLGNRSLGYVVTALAAHASDMSSWLFMGLPGIIFAAGFTEAWVALGLVFFMYLTWQWIAPALRTSTEKYGSLTLPSFFQARFNDNTGLIRITSACICLLFFACYISVNLVALGLLFKTIFGIEYMYGTALGVLAVFYILMGGFISIAWIDFFQGIFLLGSILVIPTLAYKSIGGFSGLAQAVEMRNLSLNLLPDLSFSSITHIFFAAAGWGLGYFGQPHILTKFMGIDDVKNMNKAKWIGISWQILTLGGAVFVGLVGIPFFAHAPLADERLIFISMTKMLLPTFFAGLILCAILASSLNVVSAQVLVAVSVIIEDFYKHFYGYTHTLTKARERHIVWLSRMGVLGICAAAYSIAWFNEHQSINDLIYYAWAGLGASFGPLLLVSLHTKIQSRHAALAGLFSGALSAGLWPLFNTTIPAMIVGYLVSFACIYVCSFFCKLGRTS